MFHNGVRQVLEKRGAVIAVTESGGDLYFDIQRKPEYESRLVYGTPHSLGIRGFIGREFFGNIEAVELGPNSPLKKPFLTHRIGCSQRWAVVR